MKIGPVGYGVGGRYFHAPFIVAAEGCELVGVVARPAERVAEVRQLEGGPTGRLLGPAVSVSANLDWADLDAGRTDAGLVATITHASGAHSHVSASKVNHVVSREIRVFGSLGSYVSSQTDVQAQAIFAGKRPLDDLAGWGFEAPERWGTLSTAAGAWRVPSAQGSHADYYARFAAAVSGIGQQPVPAAEAIGTLAVLDAARVSAAEGVTVAL